MTLAPSPTAPRAGDSGGGGGGDDFLFDCVSAEDLLFNNLDDADFAAMSAARSPPSSTLHPNPSVLWASSSGTSTGGGIPCESMAALLPTDAQSTFGSGRTTTSDPSSLLAGRLGSSSPIRQLPPAHHHRFPVSGDPVVDSGGFPSASSVAAAAPPISSVNHQAPATAATTVLVPHARTQGRRTNAREGNFPSVCLLAVGRGQESSSSSSSSVAGSASASGGGLPGVVDMLTRELARHGLTPEIDHVVSGERAVHRVKALARHGYAYRMVVLEVEGSLARAASTARHLRWVIYLFCMLLHVREHIAWGWLDLESWLAVKPAVITETFAVYVESHSSSRVCGLIGTINSAVLLYCCVYRGCYWLSTPPINRTQ